MFKHNLVCVSALAFTCICIHSLVKIIYLPPTSCRQSSSTKVLFCASLSERSWVGILTYSLSLIAYRSIFCEICCNVAKAPVQTSRAHLYCEACLLRWLEENDSDPSTNLKIEPDDIKKANHSSEDDSRSPNSLQI